MKYRQLLLDPIWKNKREEILKRDNYTCTECGAKGIALVVHHKNMGKLPGTYQMNF